MRHAVKFMRGVSSRRIDSWTALTKWLEQYREKGWLFRGEPDPTFDTLKPTVGRVSDKVGSVRKVEYTIEDEKRAFTEFKRAARPHLVKEPRSEIEWMALAQHHGLPTRLLDWTSSLLVATFFAVEKTGKKGDEMAGGAVIYCVKDIPEINEEVEGHKTLFDLDQVKKYHPPHLSPRITVQQSVFTIHPHPTEAFQHQTLERWVLDQKACWPIKRNLNAGGISYSSLFPDIDGVCKHIAWSYKWGFFAKGLKKAGSR
jgi:hypothetical protein